MMGRKDKPQSPLFYSFNLDEVVPQDHLLRKIDRFLALTDSLNKPPNLSRLVTSRRLLLKHSGQRD